jgi:ubiquinone/menaquinone biosynthesis C-methylase UbiE
VDVSTHLANVRRFFDSDAYLTRNPIVSIRARLVAEVLSDLRGGKVLDLGCGDGSVSRPLLATGNDVTLVDVSEAMLDRARERAASGVGGKAKYIHSDVLEWQPDSLYDAVLCIGLMAHVSSPERLVEQAMRATRSGGRCVIQFTDRGRPLGWLLTCYARIRRREGYRLNELNGRDVVRLADACGLRLVAARRYGLLLPALGRLPDRWHSWLEARFAQGLPAHAGADALFVFRRQPIA